MNRIPELLRACTQFSNGNLQKPRWPRLNTYHESVFKNENLRATGNLNHVTRNTPMSSIEFLETMSKRNGFLIGCFSFLLFGINLACAASFDGKQYIAWGDTSLNALEEAYKGFSNTTDAENYIKERIRTNGNSRTMNYPVVRTYFYTGTTTMENMGYRTNTKHYETMIMSLKSVKFIRLARFDYVDKNVFKSDEHSNEYRLHLYAYMGDTGKLEYIDVLPKSPTRQECVKLAAAIRRVSGAKIWKMGDSVPTKIEAPKITRERGNKLIDEMSRLKKEITDSRSKRDQGEITEEAHRLFEEYNLELIDQAAGDLVEVFKALMG